MAGTKCRTPDPGLVDRWIAAGYGQGDGAGYKPFMYVRDVPSTGTSSMVKSRVTGRTHHYLSRQEFKVHLEAEYSRCTKNIREQYALLPVAETQEIASELGVRHPIYPTTKTPTVMTTDLLITLAGPDGDQLLAISVKLTKDLTPRNLEKLLIEKVYWSRRGVEWLLITEKEISSHRINNLSFFELSLVDDCMSSSTVTPEDFSKQFEENWNRELSFNMIMAKATNEVGVDVHTGHTLLGRAVWNHQSRLDIERSTLTHRSGVYLKECA